MAACLPPLVGSTLTCVVIGIALSLSPTIPATIPAMQYAAVEARAQQLQDELTAAYKDKATLAEQSLQATRQLQVVRDINERQARELSDAAEEARKLREQVCNPAGWLAGWQGSSSMHL